jgi:hypothetical protein
MHEVLRRFDRETGWLATGLLGGLISAAMAIGVQLQKHPTEQVNLPVKTMEVGVDHPGIFQPQTDETATTATPDLNSEADRRNVQASPSILSTQKTLAAKAPKTSTAKSKSSKRLRIVDVKKRLIELWHQSLAKAETRSWTLFKSSNGRDKHKVSYTAETHP